MGSLSHDTWIRLAVFGIELCLTLMLVFWLRQNLRGKPESWRYFFKLLSFGAIAAVLAAVVELKYSFNVPQIQATNPALYAKYGAWYDIINNGAASAIEELAKYLIAAFTVLGGRHVHKLTDAILYLILIGLGFSLVEDAIFFLNPDTVAPYRLLSFYVHSGTSAIIGYSLGRYLSGLAPKWEMLWAVLGAIGLHFAYNLSVSLQDGNTSFYLSSLITLYISLQIFILFRRAVLEEFRLGHRFGKETTQHLLNL